MRENKKGSYMTQQKKAVVGQSGGPTSAINATLAGVISGCLSEGFTEIYGMKNGVEGFLNEQLIDLKAYFSSPDDAALTLLAHTPSAALGSCRKKIRDEETIEKMYTIFEKYEIDCFFYIGGNDSMDAVRRLSEYASAHPEKRKVCFVGVPKTIDNDLVLTDHTPGFGSAAKYIAASMQEILRDCAVYRTRAVTIVEIMGRDAGWLAASAALSNALTGVGPALIYLPECAFSSERFLTDLNRLFETGDVPYIVVAVSEGLRDENGEYVGSSAMSGAVDSFGHKYLSGTGKYLENLVREKIGCKVRSVEVNILQRCAAHLASQTDLSESLSVGKAAAHFGAEGQSGVMAAFVREENEGQYSVRIEAVPVGDVANAVKKVPREFINAEGNGVTKACIDYLAPLIRGEVPVEYKDGLPIHFSF